MPATQPAVRIAINNILFPTDFSAVSEAALPYATALAAWYDAQVIVAHSVPLEPVIIPMEPMPLDLNFEWVNAERKMATFAANHPMPGTRHETVLQQGELWDVLSSLIDRHEIDLVVLGTHGRQGLSKLVMGSAAEEIFRRARCPVLTVGPKAARDPGEFENWKTILFATDFSAGSLKALPYALSLAEENEAKLIMLHLVPLVPIQEQQDIEHAVVERLQSMIPDDAAAWCDPDYLVDFDFPAAGIIRVAEQRNANVIVMGVHHADKPKRSSHLPWATTHEVVCNAHCPVLTVRG